jgi:ammonium transporter Rh
MVLQPYGAFLAGGDHSPNLPGSLAGVISTIGYKTISGKLFTKLKIHDTCGVGGRGPGTLPSPQVNNLHGMPGLLGGLLSVLVVMLASEETYGAELYKVFPLCAPGEVGEWARRIRPRARTS